MITINNNNNNNKAEKKQTIVKIINNIYKIGRPFFYDLYKLSVHHVNPENRPQRKWNRKCS